MNLTKIIIAGDNYLFRAGMKSLIEKNKEFALVAEACNGEETLNKVVEHKANVLVLDLSTIFFKAELISEIKKTAPSIQILAINAQQPKQFIVRTLEQGVTSYLLLHCEEEEITEALRKTSLGERFLCGHIIEILISNGKKNQAYDTKCPLYSYCDGVNVSEREIEIIKCIAEGYSNQEIADKLFISVHTVTTHRKNIMSKLGINNTAGLVML